MSSGNVALRTLGGVQTKFQTATPMGSLAYAEGYVCLNFELFLVGGAGLKFYWYDPEFWVRALPAAGGSFKSYRFFSPHPTRSVGGCLYCVLRFFTANYCSKGNITQEHYTPNANRTM